MAISEKGDNNMLKTINAVNKEEKDYWKLDKDTYALYTTNANIKELAINEGLKVMARYYTRDGKLYAMQFVGNKETVMKIYRRELPFKPFS